MYLYVGQKHTSIIATEMSVLVSHIILMVYICNAGYKFQAKISSLTYCHLKCHHYHQYSLTILMPIMLLHIFDYNPHSKI